jgi:hypothetical protein
VPRVSCWFVRTSLVYLALSFTLGALLLANKGLSFSPALWRLQPTHIEFALTGWVIQLGLGVAWWIFPRFVVPRAARGSDAAAWTAFALLNAGVWMAGPGSLVGSALALAGRLAEAGAAGVLAAGLWARVRASGLSEM